MPFVPRRVWTIRRFVLVWIDTFAVFRSPECNPVGSLPGPKATASFQLSSSFPPETDTQASLGRSKPIASDRATGTVCPSFPSLLSGGSKGGMERRDPGPCASDPGR
eukprot:scaffold126_cov315-Pavlova_lutheri.AAC.3